MFKNQRARDVDTGECLYYSSRSVAIQVAVCLIQEGKCIAVESLTDKGEWISDLNSCFILENIILSSFRRNKQKSAVTSEVSSFREKQALTEQSAHNGLYGYQIVSPHDFIEARMTKGADHILTLMQEGDIEQAVTLMNAPMWGESSHHHAMIPNEG